MDLNHLFFSFDGRINRKPYWIGMVVLAAANVVLSLVLGPLFGIEPGEMTAEHRQPGAVTLDLLINLILFWPGLAITVKRLHDRDKPALLGIVLYALFGFMITLEFMGLAGTPEQPAMPFLVLLIAMVVVGLWLLVELGFQRGTPGENMYGPNPLETVSQQGK